MKKTHVRSKTAIGCRRVVVLEGAPSSVEHAAGLLELGRRLHNLYGYWTEDDEESGECANSGSGADIAAAIFAILTDNGYPVN